MKASRKIKTDVEDGNEISSESAVKQKLSAALIFDSKQHSAGCKCNAAVHLSKLSSSRSSSQLHVVRFSKRCLLPFRLCQNHLHLMNSCQLSAQALPVLSLPLNQFKMHLRLRYTIWTAVKVPVFIWTNPVTASESIPCKVNSPRNYSRQSEVCLCQLCTSRRWRILHNSFLQNGLSWVKSDGGHL